MFEIHVKKTMGTLHSSGPTAAVLIEGRQNSLVCSQLHGGLDPLVLGKFQSASRERQKRDHGTCRHKGNIAALTRKKLFCLLNHGPTPKEMGKLSFLCVNPALTGTMNELLTGPLVKNCPLMLLKLEQL